MSDLHTQPEDCPSAPLYPRDSDAPIPCAMSEVETGATMIKTAQQCTRCGWVDPASLDRWAEHAIKSSMDTVAQRVALAADGEPFTFVRSSSEDIGLPEALGQALGAASMCWETPEAAGIFDGSRARRIYEQLWLLVAEKYRDQERAALDAARERLAGYFSTLGGNGMLVVDANTALHIVVSGNKDN